MKLEKRPCEHCNGTGKVFDDAAVGEEMRRMREDAGVSLREMARYLSLSPAYVSDLELGRRRWSTAKVVAYQGALDRRAA